MSESRVSPPERRGTAAASPLSSWLGERHWDQPRLTDIPRASADCACFVVDGLLQADLADALIPLFSTDGQWADVFGLYSLRGHCSETAWRNAVEEHRFYNYGELGGPPSGRPLAPGWAAWLMIRRRFESLQFLSFVSSATGVAPERLQNQQAHAMRPGHYLKPHSDGSQSRTLCAAYYVGEGWRVGFGGEFEMLRGSETTAVIEPLHNRLVLFDPLGHDRHAVRPIDLSAGDWQRNSISIWWQGLAAKAE